MSSPDNDFEDLQKLLRCKQYEQPPPGYFLSFSDKVLARIEVEEVASYSSWWSWFVASFDAKPVLVCAYGLVVSSLLFMGFRLSQVFEAEVASVPTVAGPWLALTPGSPVLSSHDVGAMTYSESAVFTTLDDTKLASPEDSLRLLPPRNSWRVQTAGFNLSSP